MLPRCELQCECNGKILKWQFYVVAHVLQKMLCFFVLSC